MAINPKFSPETIKGNIPSDVDRLLPPSVVADLVGVDTKWLAGAREGRKAIKGPPYVKLGEGRTAPIRYRLSSLIEWLDSLQERVSTIERTVVPHGSFERFISEANPTDKWLFVVSKDRRDATEIFAALQGKVLQSDVRLQWLTRSEYITQRFARLHLQLHADTLEYLLALGNGDPAAGLAKLTEHPLPTVTH